MIIHAGTQFFLQEKLEANAKRLMMELLTPRDPEWWRDNMIAIHAWACDTDEPRPKYLAEPWMKLSIYDVSCMSEALAERYEFTNEKFRRFLSNISEVPEDRILTGSITLSKTIVTGDDVLIVSVWDLYSGIKKKVL